MTIIKGGAAGFSSVTFYSERNKSKAIRKRDGKIYVELSKRKLDSKFNKGINKIPLIRGLFLFVKPIINMWKLYLIIILPLYALLILSTTTKQEYLDASFLTLVESIYLLIINRFLLVLSLVLLSLALVFRLSSLAKYHAAEHMTDTSFEKNKSISLLDVANQSRVHSYCGTNIVVFIFFFYSVLSFFTMNFFILIVLSICLAYEAFLFRPRLLKPLFWLGSAFQYALFTAKPTNQHLEVAIAAYEALIREEEIY